ncbi:UNVERIFIED_CONTAM: hypothetical protein PYX00_008017 [Menopon gallinae]|uniref:Uncharacterized protein n=1 Tax=Menopon gallinae TaxID=328185 RepID=A0AAW2HLT4_9NEOP
MIATATGDDIASRMKRSVLFTPGAGMGIYLAVAWPLDLPQYEISVALNVEANYYLPTNATELAYGPQIPGLRQARDLSRSRIYSLIEDRLEMAGYESRSCLLRTICETSASTVRGHNGLLGELLHIIFTPSSTEDEDISSDYSDAEKAGVDGRENCMRSYPGCPIDLYELFTVWSA